MKPSVIKYREVDELLVEYAQHKGAVRRRLNEFAAVSHDEYFYELAYCILTPQSSAVNAGKAIEALKGADFLGHDVDATEILSRKQHYIRFHNTKARRLGEVKEKFREIAARLTKGAASPEIREWLAKNVRGLGWKEASHFLRNIGHRELSILDRHILKNLKKHGVIRSIPKTLTPKRYIAIEQKFVRFARDIGVAMDELDLVFWRRETGEILK